MCLVCMQAWSLELQQQCMVDVAARPLWSPQQLSHGSAAAGNAADRTWLAWSWAALQQAGQVLLPAGKMEDPQQQGLSCSSVGLHSKLLQQHSELQQHADNGTGPTTATGQGQQVTRLEQLLCRSRFIMCGLASCWDSCCCGECAVVNTWGEGLDDLYGLLAIG